MRMASGNLPTVLSVVFILCIRFLSVEQIYCPAAEAWPQTAALTTAVLSCGVGFFGEQTRFCDANGQWGEATVTTCST